MTMRASLAQLGERQTEDLKVPGSIPGGGNRLPCLSDTRGRVGANTASQ